LLGTFLGGEYVLPLFTGQNNVYVTDHNFETSGNFFVEKFTDFPQLPWKIVSTIGPPYVYEFLFFALPIYS